MYNETMYLNYYDLNNVEDLIDYVIDRLKVVSEEYLISNSHLWLPNDFPYIQEIDRIEKLIDSCGKNYYLPEGWQECKVWLTGNETEQVIKSFSFEDINRWIINLQLLKASVDTFTFSAFRGSDIIINDLPVNSRFRWFKLYGDTFQQTYSGKNLFNINTPPTWIGGGTTYSINDNVLKVQGNWYVGFLINIQENTDYYLNALKNIIVSQTGTGNMAIYDKNKQFIKQLNNGGTFNSGSNNQIYLVFYSGFGNSGEVEFSDIQLEKGNTSTSYEPYVGGTASPNPDYPQEIQSVTGRQVVDIEGKNLFNKNTITSGKLVERGTGNLVTNNSYGATDYIPIGENTTITMTNFNVWYTACYDKNKNYLGYMKNANTMTTLPNTAYIRASILLTNVNTGQIEKGNQATTYEPYQGQQFEINLGKNLFNGTYIAYAIGGNSGHRFFSNASSKTAIVQCQPNTTYTITKFATSNRFNICDYPTYPVNNDELNQLAVNHSATTLTVTTNSDANYLCIFVSNNSVEPQMQIEKGSVATTYSPYFEPIELNKIGEYQDYIDGDIDNWYVNSYVGKVVLDGSENNLTFNSERNGIYNYQLTTDNAKYYSSNNECLSIETLSNYFNANIGSQWYNNLLPFISLISNKRILIGTNFSTINEFKTWLSTHNTNVYYVLAEPTRTKITNTELVSQLNNLAENKMLSGYKHIVVNGDLPGILNAEYLSNTGDYTTIWNMQSFMNWNESSNLEWSDE